MKGIRDWVFSQIVSKSVVSSPPISGGEVFSDEEPLDEDSDDQGEAGRSSLVSVPVHQVLSCSPDDIQEQDPQTSAQQILYDHSDNSHQDSNPKKTDPLLKIEELQLKFLRLLRRLRLPENNLLVAKVSYRIHLATLIRAEESDLKRIKRRSDRVRASMAQEESSSALESKFSIRVLVLGKTGVGKSATINSVFEQTKTTTNAFRPATNRIQEIVGSFDGLTITFIDTPGLLPPSTLNLKRNKKILLSVKRFIKKSPPDIVLYFDRLDLFGMGYSDSPLLKLVSETFGPAIWFNTILVMTHSSAALPINLESYVAHCTDLVQHDIHQAVSDTKLENPVLLVENHPQCKRNSAGDKILPNGQVWKSQLLLLCICTKVLGDVNVLLKLQESIELGPANAARLPSLPHLLSTLLRHRKTTDSDGADNEIDESFFSKSELEEEEEYDQLPPIRILSKSQFGRLSKSQINEYLDELDYRETLYLTKQLKEEYRRQSEIRLSKGKDESAGEGPENEEESSLEDVSLPDMAIPPSFDLNFPVHRYRGMVSSDQWLVRPTLDPQGWDHDVGFDGISVETATAISKDITGSITGQMSKDKQGFTINSECSALYSGPGKATYSVGLDVQSAGKDLMCTLHSDTKLKNLWHNTADYGVSLISLRNKYFLGAKIEDTISVGKRLKFMVNAGRVGGQGKVAYGGNFEVTLRGRDYPVRNDSVSVAMTLLSFNKEKVLGGNFQSKFRLNRNLRLAVNANLNTRRMGQVSVKTSSSEHLHITLVAAFTIFKFLLRRRKNENNDEKESL